MRDLHGLEYPFLLLISQAPLGYSPHGIFEILYLHGNRGTRPGLPGVIGYGLGVAFPPVYEVQL